MLVPLDDRNLGLGSWRPGRLRGGLGFNLRLSKVEPFHDAETGLCIADSLVLLHEGEDVTRSALGVARPALTVRVDAEGGFVGAAMQGAGAAALGKLDSVVVQQAGHVDELLDFRVVH
ncbi:MAG: hypothetical protein JXR25_11080 [Pontiellaceae bacterium]|nr:hypothetical protein [Pontiellaceae bacterium]